MPRYFFTIRRPGRVKDDPHGTNLPDVAAALSYAECKIVELRKESPYNDPALMMIIKGRSPKDGSILTVLSWMLTIPPTRPGALPPTSPSCQSCQAAGRVP